MSKNNQLNTRLTLMSRIKDKHDEESWQEFVNYYKQYIYNITRSMKLSHHDATEIVQIIMVKLWDKLPEFDVDSIRGKFRNWLYTVTANQVKDYIKARDRKNTRHQKAEQEKSYLRNITVPEVEKIATKEWESYIAQLAWNNVSPNFEESVKNAFLMFTEGYDVKTISTKLNISESSVYVYKKRVQDKLQKEYNRLNAELW